MCGICGGIWSDSEKGLDQDTLDKMTDILRHRGPDDRGTYLESGPGHGVALGHRRLSIIDLSEQGRQPIANEDGTVLVVLNGEIYNFAPIRRELVERGHRFTSQTDTEVLVHLYEEEGEKMLERLNGMFAFALWDARRQCLFVARDRIGKKPLYYLEERGRFAFASELKSILEIEGVSREIDPFALDDYLCYQYIPHPRTIFRSISKLLPGHYGIWRHGVFSVTRYWNPDFQTEENGPSCGEWSEQLRSLLGDAVKIRLRSDVPLGMFLSGGIDSSIITGLIKDASPNPVRTFSIGFHDKEYDETSLARQTAERLGTLHREYFVEPEMRELLPKLIWHYDEPYADSSAIPTWYLCQMTRQDVAVALSGDGGDEVFAGYERYQAVRMGARMRCLPRFIRSFLASPVQGLLPHSLVRGSLTRRLKRFLASLSMEPLEQYVQWIGLFSAERYNALYSDDFCRQLAGHDSLAFLADAQKFCSNRDPVTQASLIDIQTYLPCDILTKVDIAAMAHALECRAPILDYRVIEWAAKMPIRHKLHGNRGKYLFRETFRDYLLPEVDSRRKTGFAVPLAAWFRGPLKDLVADTLLSETAAQRELFQRPYVEQLLKDHFESRMDNSRRIWPLFVLELWFRQWSGS